ncbi:FAD-dependent oxidoreductase [Methylobacterium variabile]|jgi:3-(3-hydroxy-phenyl)propionate hydroxylase|uniref:FAD-dependent oxidoreductase n=1 Tax=Methylobacterium variabile TaxID=298794 RepID=A0A0J6T390_9HYPH|nr:FAD-dependent oxidoreductase [Methylobacterium variabile]KMO40424.1 FAD-dependent oxidoreductase [Methylobacterium variabile]
MTSHPRFAHTPLPEAGRRRPVVVIGAGPVGLTCAIDLATRGVPVVVLDDDDTVATGSRAICWAKRTLEIWDRLGVGSRMVEKGVTWSVGRVFHGDQELYRFDLLPESGHRRPAFVNLQQYYVEEYLIARAADFPDLISLRWKHEVAGLTQSAEGVRLDVATPDGAYVLDAEWVLAADGARSPTRTRMGLPFPGQRFEERFLIADVRMKADFPTERLFWFEPTFHAGQSALLHRQPDDVFRIDFQLGPEADPDLERTPERVMPRVRAVVGEDTPVTLEWCSVYSFRCARLERFVHGRVVFVGDSAHVVSPFGARGGNGGIQDADNLCWKLALVLAGEAPESLIATYDEERGRGADENILNSSRTTNFMTPKTKAERHLRDGVLDLAAEAPFARALLNAGRLSRPCSLAGLSLQTPDPVPQAAGPRPGDPCVDAPVVDAAGQAGWLLDRLGGPFTLLVFAGPEAPDLGRLPGLVPGLRCVVVAGRPMTVPGAEVLRDAEGVAGLRYGAQPGSGPAYLIRPDAHVAARFAEVDAEQVAEALARASGRSGTAVQEAA